MLLELLLGEVKGQSGKFRGLVLSDLRDLGLKVSHLLIQRIIRVGKVGGKTSVVRLDFE